LPVDSGATTIRRKRAWIRQFLLYDSSPVQDQTAFKLVYLKAV
jgi:hypothetical protein